MLLAFSAEARLVDVDVMDDRTSDELDDSASEASDFTPRRGGYWANVLERDKTCVITGDFGEDSNACHILPHAKGSNVRSH